MVPRVLGTLNFDMLSIFFRERRLSIKNELAIREKALKDPDFPSQDIINEFLTRKDKIPESLDLSWVQPNLIAFVVS